MKNQENSAGCKIRFKFYKKDEYKYLSHLDIVNIITRALKRAGIKTKYSCGYRPKPKINFSNPTPLGVDSFAEYCDVIVLEDIEECEFLSAVNLQLIPQMMITRAKKIDIKSASLSSGISACLYCFELGVSGSTGSFINEFTESVKNNIKNKSDFSSSIFELMVETSNEDIIFVKLYGYVKIFKSLNNEIFKFNNFLEFFQNWIKKYSIINISYMKKEELYIFENNTLKTPMEII